jgi:hypothetical protein
MVGKKQSDDIRPMFDFCFLGLSWNRIAILSTYFDPVCISPCGCALLDKKGNTFIRMESMMILFVRKTKQT